MRFLTFNCLGKMIKSVFLADKIVSRVDNIRKKGILKRRSTFERPISSYDYPVVGRNRIVRGRTSLDTETNNINLDVENATRIMSTFVPATNNVQANLETQVDVHENEIGHHVITMVHLETHPVSSLNEVQGVIPLADLPHSPMVNEDFNANDSFDSPESEEIIATNFQESVADKLNRSSIISNSNQNQNSQENIDNSNEDLNINENDNGTPVLPTSSRHFKSKSLVLGINSVGLSEVGPLQSDIPMRRSSFIEVTRVPPITLSFIPSGLQIEDRVVWVTENEPENGTVRWIGKIRGHFYAGVELDKPIGNSSGLFGYGPGLQKRLFTCKLSHGRFIPVKELVRYSDYHDNGLKAGIICIICRDDFLDTWEPCGDLKTFDDFGKMVATKNCGHLFHAGCLNEWFNRKKYDIQPCPYCQIPMDRNDIIRIFPAQF